MYKYSRIIVVNRCNYYELCLSIRDLHSVSNNDEYSRTPNWYRECTIDVQLALINAPVYYDQVIQRLRNRRET